LIHINIVLKQPPAGRFFLRDCLRYRVRFAYNPGFHAVHPSWPLPERLRLRL